MIRHHSGMKRLAATYGARNIRIFGSVARGHSSPSSNVDFLVEIDPDRTLVDLGGLLTGLHDTLQAPVDVATERMLRPAIRGRALQEAVPLRETAKRGLTGASLGCGGVRTQVMRSLPAPAFSRGRPGSPTPNPAPAVRRRGCAGAFPWVTPTCETRSIGWFQRALTVP